MDTILGILIVIACLVAFGASLRKFGSKPAERKKSERKKQNLPDRGETITVKIGGKDCRAILLDSPKPEKKKDDKPAYVPKAWR